ncbi:MAG: tRNA (N(6)-L-threonylcarbamoyladenosine(37)-C(2))-methylthiotransferase MtaB [Candidatus Paracaedibacteraceae bacterium]|nr:tRNA (N(6)-L-threonylcarbamoyladenosine(37)-C(2))-methylthiotransferase MtaB [Candidatus Paracaedibacteraceae bacterium]
MTSTAETTLSIPLSDLQSSTDPKLITFGCRLNTYESEVIRSLTKAAGLENAIIINTCAVTAEAERQARQTIRKLRRENPDAKIIVTGCSAQVNADSYTKMTEVDAVIGNDDKMKIDTYTGLKNPGHERLKVNDIMSVTETALHLVSGFDGKARAFVQVQNGCNHRCTFCIIPYGRGNSRSVAIGEIVDQLRALVQAGYHEIAFTGVDITAYGEDLPGTPTLGQMIRRVLALVPDLKRLRLSSLDPVEIDEDLWQLIETEPRLMPHLHMSLQAGDNMILKRMKRRHLREDAIAFCKKARALRPEVAFGADLIAGFPTETDEMFENTLRIVDECDLTYLHVFPYSPRPGTPASKMPQLQGAVIKERAARLRKKGDEAEQRFYDRLVGQEVTILVESIEGDTIKGKTDHFAPVIVKNIPIGISIAPTICVKIHKNESTHLLGGLL